MHSFSSPVRFLRSFARLLTPPCCFLLLVAGRLPAQSTFGSILGTVHDTSGAVVQGAQVTLVNTGTTAARALVTDASGDYAFKNIDVGTYTLTFTAQQFQKESLPNIPLSARETLRMDATLQPGVEAQTVVVIDDPEPAITTDVSNLAVTKAGDELENLPVAIYSRSAGSTSPISTLTTEAGVQTDDGGNLSVMGTTAALLSVTIDGISSVGVEYSGPVNEMFPSFNSIEEIRVSETNNNAEFSGVADITTVSKAGTNRYHGGLFENHENTILNANNPFAISKPKIIMNDFGGTLGGALKIPHLSLGDKHAYFFSSFEGLLLPRQTPILASVPSADMRNGNIGYYLDQTYCEPNPAVQCPDGYTVYNPDGSTLTNSLTNTPVNVTTISSNLLKYLMPTPNYGPAGSFVNNYQTNFPSPISANQGDLRLDGVLSDKQTMFARFSYKNRQVTTAPNTTCTFSYCGTAGSPLQGAYNTPEIDEGMTFAHNYVFTSNLLNEFRAGYNAQHTSEEQGYSTTSLLAQTGVGGITEPDTKWSEAPQLLINGFMATGAGNPGVQRGQIIEVLDNVSWNFRKHIFKFGADFKRLTDHDDNVFGNYRSGWYVFDGSSVVGTTIGDPYASFLLGDPDYTEIGTVNNPTMNGLGYSSGYFAQDDWHITPNLTLNLGLRYELHPPLKETHYNTAFFLPDYSATIGGQQVSGAVVVPNTQAETFESDQLLAAISPTPILTAAQAGIPETLRYTDTQDWGPRLGFAWRPYGNEKTVLRGGWGRFIEAPLGFSLVSGWAVHASYIGIYSQAYQADGVTPVLSFSDPFDSSAGSSTGTAGFYYAFPIHYQDPSVQQWNLTFEQDLGSDIGLRLSYAGSHGVNLETMEDLNQVPANTIGYNNTSPAPAATGACLSDGGTLVSDHRPYPCWSIIDGITNAAWSNYNSGTVEVARHGGKSITFDASYTYTRDLSNAGGATPNAFAIAGGNFATDRFHPGLDYGNVSYDRRHRFLVTYLYNLPLGRGKRWFSNGSAANTLAGAWQLAGVTILQTGAFLTPYEQSVDPANTNILTTVGQTRPDQLNTMPLYASRRTTAQWLNPNAFSYQNLATNFGMPNQLGIGRFGNAPVGGVIGPGTANFSISLLKQISIVEHAKFQFGLEAANVMNHRNYEPPNMQVDSAGFGSITALQTAEGAGPRSLELTGRLNF